jgi:anti-sigma regulatory factor (Ser/Thr protein kinase)
MLGVAAIDEARDFPVAQQAVAEMDRWIEEVGQRWGIDERILFRARVCVSELAANVIEHGCAQATDEPIRIGLRCRPPAFEIEFSDPGREFDPFLAQSIQPDDERVGGRGIKLIRSFASASSYRRVSGRNVITLQLVPGSASA